MDIRTENTVELAALIQAVNALRAPGAACVDIGNPGELEIRLRKRIHQLIKFLHYDEDWSAWST